MWPSLLLTLYVLQFAKANEDALTRKAQYMEAGLNIDIDPCKDFWTYANGNINGSLLKKQFHTEAVTVLEEAKRPNKIKSINEVLNHFDECKRSPQFFFDHLRSVVANNIELAKDIRDFTDKIHNNSLVKSDQGFLELIKESLRLNFKYGASKSLVLFKHLYSANYFEMFKNFKSVNLMENNGTMAKEFFNGIFKENIDISQFANVTIGLPDLESRKHALLDTPALLQNLTLLPKFYTCENYIMNIFPLYYRKLVYDHYGGDYVKKATETFRGDIDALVKTARTEFTHGNMLSDPVRKRMLSLLDDNTFYLIDHPIFEDEMFETYFNKVSLKNPVHDQGMNNVRPMIRAAEGKNSSFLWTAETVFNAFHTSGNRNFFNWPLFTFPMYDPSFPPSLRLSGSGFVASHELGHGFDTELDSIGKNDPTYGQINDCLHEFYSNQCDPDNPQACIDAKNNIKENFADYFGVRMSYLAYKRTSLLYGTKEQLKGKILDKMSDDQIFFINLAQTMARFQDWKRHNIGKDTHSPGPVRLWGVLAGVKAFTNAFNCSAKSHYFSTNNCKMYDGDVKPNYNLTKW